MRRAPRVLRSLLVSVCLALAAGCAGVKQTPGTGNGGTSGGGAHDGGPGPVDAITLPDAITATCGNGMLDPGEVCDDGNKNSGDGCTKLCQKTDGFDCPTPGQPCVITAVCGDGVLASTEQCDDHNKTSNDGCSDKCTIESGYECRVPGRPCVPACGDGKIIGGEQCDDGNSMDGDGCSSTCVKEPGATCTGTPSKCTSATCGNGMMEGNEGCDCGTDPTKLPANCTGPNGLFNGDGTGCSKTCTKEPVCRDANGKTQACETKCGNGNIENKEDCDDGNTNDGDGCDHNCKVEGGFTCETVGKSDAQNCTQGINTGGKCLELPVKYRDFKSEHETGGHPDFFYYGSTIPSPITVNSTTHGAISFAARYCVPNSAGPARQNDSTARCWDLAQANLDKNGRPAFNSTRTGGTTCDCQFTDWSHNGGDGNNVPGYGSAAAPSPTHPLGSLTYVGSGNKIGSPWYKGPAPVVSSATTFGQWWADGSWESDGTTTGKHATQVLELAPVAGGTNLYRFSSAPHSVWGGFFPLDPAANNFPIYTTSGSASGPGTVKTTSAPWSEPLLCNNWPYWYPGTTDAPGFGAVNGCRATQYVFAPAYGPTVGSDPAAWFGMNINGGNITNAQGWYHDSWFSIEARYLFAFNSQFDLQFFGDDDTFVFINGVLIIDLGGVHQRLPGKVHVDANGAATIQEGGNIYMACTNSNGSTNCPTIPAGAQVGDIVPCTGGMDPVTKVAFNSTCASGNTTCDCRQRTLTAAQTGLMPGNTYEIAVFSRDGHPSESNFQLTLSGFTTNQSNCGPHCGDGVRTGAEECDCGDAQHPSSDASCGGMTNNNDTYGGCTMDCKYGPYCGDGHVDASGGEKCDLGSKNNTTLYTNTKPTGDACSPGCQFPHYCGDAIVDDGEDCDLGPNNGAMDQPCDARCHVVIN